MEIRKPLLTQNIKILMCILIFAYMWIPTDNLSLVFKYILAILGVLLSLILLLDVYNPDKQNRVPFIWKLRIFFWGDPNIKIK